MSVQVGDFVIELFYHFKRSVKKKAILRDYMAFTNTEVKKMVKHVTTQDSVAGLCCNGML